MAEIDCVTLPAFRYLSGESENICMLCFNTSDGGVCLDESRPLTGCFNEEITVTFEDMLKDLGAAIDPSLPQMICECCADLAINAFQFKKLCQLSFNKWAQAIEKFQTVLHKTDKLSYTSGVKTTYLVVQNENSLVLTSQKLHREKSKEVLEKIEELLKARKKNACQRLLSLKCDDCGGTFTSKYYFKKHLKSYGAAKYPCPQCPLLLPTETRLNAHLEGVHKPKNIQCSKCAKMFGSERMLRYHDAENHTTVRCKLCLIEFPSRRKLRQHLNRHNKNTNKCPECEKEFNNKKIFKKHLKLCRTNEMEKLEFICDICKKVYNTKIGLKSHLLTIHGFGRLVYCNWCKKPFDSVSKLNNHTVKHTRERNFHCEQCGGQFVTKPALVNHIRIHTGERPFPCEICGECFLSTSRRMEHKRRKHIGPERECNICHGKFFTSFDLRRHMARHNNPQSRIFASGKGEEINKSTRKRKIMYF